ncbi:alpha-amylase family glycosyl hydrolase [Ruminococcus sp.]|uniref:alpha-amylase family glycosyl hydrolase n=1 Tax=Ruminococcus sp. TaxID=41978 RepID=UPI0038907F8A
MFKKLLSLMMVISMLLTCLLSAGVSVSAQQTDAAETGLTRSCQDGNILQCFNWTLSQIKEELPNIAKAGFTCVQTSPLQAHDGRNQWYWLYQPTGFTIGNELGSYSDLEALCEEADKYGVRIIVDVVANHLAGSNSGNLANSVEAVFKNNKSTYFHNLGAKSNDDNRYEVTQKNIGMPDLNSENTALQEMVAAMIEKYKAAGVDGIRWDAAKHIALPSENCGFWSRMAQIDIYQYGEILGAPAGNSHETINNPLMQEYAQYLSVTDSKYSSELLSAVRNGSIYKTTGYWNKRDIASDHLVYWAESHDTYSNDGDEGWTKNLDQGVIDKAYAILGARAESHALYLSRPSAKNSQSIYYGRKGSTHYTCDAITAVNRFHNAMIGTAEKYYTNANCYVVSRSDSKATGGAVIVSMKNADVDVSVNNSGALVPVGTYTDQVSGSSWTVTDTKITGHIGSSGIAVIQTERPLIGDTDLNGTIDIVDVTMIQKDVSLMITLTQEQRAAADADLNGAVEITDASMLQRYLADIEVIGSHIGELLPVT